MTNGTIQSQSQRDRFEETAPTIELNIYAKISLQETPNWLQVHDQENVTMNFLLLNVENCHNINKINQMRHKDLMNHGIITFCSSDSPFNIQRPIWCDESWINIT